MYEFDELFCDSTPTEIVDSIGNFSTHEDYFTRGIYGVDSFNCIDECSVWFPFDIADFAIRNDEDFCDVDIREILDEEEDEND